MLCEKMSIDLMIDCYINDNNCLICRLHIMEVFAINEAYMAPDSVIEES